MGLLSLFSKISEILLFPASSYFKNSWSNLFLFLSLLPLDTREFDEAWFKL
jgi:hypothetical protein